MAAAPMDDMEVDRSLGQMIDGATSVLHQLVRLARQLLLAHQQQAEAVQAAQPAAEHTARIGELQQEYASVSSALRQALAACCAASDQERRRQQLQQQQQQQQHASSGAQPGEGDPAELARLEERLAQLQQQAQQKSWRLKVLIDRCRGMLDSLNMWETSQQALAAGS